jgi:hypothetical protein
MDGRTLQIANVAIDGPRVAWRGLQRGKLFEPYAVIVRVQVLAPKSGRAFVEPASKASRRSTLTFSSSIVSDQKASAR